MPSPIHTIFVTERTFDSSHDDFILVEFGCYVQPTNRIKAASACLCRCKKCDTPLEWYFGDKDRDLSFIIEDSDKHISKCK